MSTPELLPCDWSSHSAIVIEDGMGFYARCSYDFCEKTTAYYETEEEAAAAWNRSVLAPVMKRDKEGDNHANGQQEHG